MRPTTGYRLTTIFIKRCWPPLISHSKPSCATRCTIEYDQGGYILPVFNPNIDAHSTTLAGVVPGRCLGLSFGGYDFKHYWIT